MKGLYLDLGSVLEGDGDSGVLGDGHMIDHRQPVLIPEDRQWLPLLQARQKQLDSFSISDSIALVTIIANDLDPYRYLVYILDEAPKMAAREEDWITAVLPENAPDSCKAGKN